MLAFLDRAADARSILQSVTERFPRLGRRSQSIGEFRALLNDLAGKIVPDGSVPDHASVALGRLRRDIERQKKSIQESLERFLRAHHEEGVLAGRVRHHPQRALRGSGDRRPAAQDRRRHSRRQLERPHALRRAARNHRPEQRTGAAHGRRAARSASHPARTHRASARLRGFHSQHAGHHGRAGMDLRQSEVRHRIRLRDGPVSAPRMRGAWCSKMRGIRCWKMSCGASSNERCPSAWSWTPRAARC